MSFDVRSASEVSGVGSEFTLAAPAGILATDKLYVLLLHDSNIQVAAPPGQGAVIISSHFEGNGTLRLFEAKSGSESLTFSFYEGEPSNVASSHYVCVGIAVTRDSASPPSPITLDVTAYAATASSTGPAVCPNVTPGNDNDVLISVAAWLHGTSFTTPGGWTGRANGRSGNGAADRSMWVGSKKLAGGKGELQTGPSVVNENPFSQAAGVFKVAQLAISVVPPVTSWSGDLSTGDLSQFPSVIRADREGYPGFGHNPRIEVLSDTPPAGYANYLRMWVNNGDVSPLTPTVNPRGQLSAPRILLPGYERWISWMVRLPENFPSIPMWLLLAELFGPPFGGGVSPTFSLDIEKENFVLATRSYPDNPPDPAKFTFKAPWKTPIIRGVWLPFVWRLYLAQDETGRCELWYRGKRQRLATGKAWQINLKSVNLDQNEGVEPSFMSYRAVGQFTECSVDFAAMSISPTPPAGLELSPSLPAGKRAGALVARVV